MELIQDLLCFVVFLFVYPNVLLSCDVYDYWSAKRKGAARMDQELEGINVSVICSNAAFAINLFLGTMSILVIRAIHSEYPNVPCVR